MVDTRKMKRSIFNLRLIIVFMIFLKFGLIVLIGAVYYSGEQKRKDTLETLTYVKDKISDDAVITDGERALRAKKFWAKIIGVYGVANHDRAMGKAKMAEFINNGVRWARMLNLPEMYAPSIAVMESGFDSYCVGGIGEVGIFQHHVTALPSYHWYLRQMYVLAPEVARELDAQVLGVGDLTDPIKSLQVQYVLAWGVRREFPEELYWISAVHWGTHRVKPWFIARTEPKEYYVFYSRTNLEKIDRRSPLMYYFFYKRILSNFERFQVDLGGKWIAEYQDYRAKCNRNEKEYIDSRALVAKLMKQAAIMEAKTKDIDDARADIRAYRSRIENIDDELGKIYGEYKKKKDFVSMYRKTKEMLKQRLGGGK